VILSCRNQPSWIACRVMENAPVMMGWLAITKKVADGTPELLAFARPIAEAQVDIFRIRRARVDMLSRQLHLTAGKYWPVDREIRAPRGL
jgi:hypothetical protein